MLPPAPPSPPDGPPRGTYFSRRKAMQPLPPRPARTWTVASSRKAKAGGRAGGGAGPSPGASGLLGREDVDELAAAAPVLELADAADLHPQEVLPVADGAAVLLAPLLLEDPDLGAAHLADQRRRHQRPLDDRVAHLDAAVARDHEHPIELDRAPIALGRDPLDVEHVARRDPVLFATTLDHREHRKLLGIALERGVASTRGREKLPRRAAAVNRSAAADGGLHRRVLEIGRAHV